MYELDGDVRVYRMNGVHHHFPALVRLGNDAVGFQLVVERDGGLRPLQRRPAQAGVFQDVAVFICADTRANDARLVAALRARDGRVYRHHDTRQVRVLQYAQRV